jgi:quinoprotein glucose dehydrogenase
LGASGIRERARLGAIIDEDRGVASDRSAWRLPVSWARRLGLLPLMTIGCVSCLSGPDSEGTAAPDVEWSQYAGGNSGKRYSPLADIDRNNVGHLRIAWTARAGDFPPEVFDPQGHRAGDRREDGAPVHPRPGASCGTCHSRQIRFQTTPLMRDGLLFLSTPRSRVLALDPATGEERWSFDPGAHADRGLPEHLVSRGVAAWFDETAPTGSRCAHRIFLGTLDARLFALDALDGGLCGDFGENGVVDLAVDAEPPGGTVEPGRYGMTSPPAVVGNVVVVGSGVDKSRRTEVESGVVRGYCARTGALLWALDPVPRSGHHPAWEYWKPSSAATTGGANVWAPMSGDDLRDLVFLPTSSAAPDHYGGDRPGRNDLANSIVAVQASSGEVRWWYQLVHHDLWDYDVAAQPILIELRRGQTVVPAVVVGTKTGSVFVFHRETGEPLFDIEERSVPPSDVPGEEAWPTQPFSVGLPSLHGNRLSADSAFGTTPVEREYCRGLLASLRNEGLFTPPALEGTLQWPGLLGGINWDSMAWDPDRQILVTSLRRMGMMVRLVPQDEDGTAGARDRAPYDVVRTSLVSPSGTPCTPPPWGVITALDLMDGTIRWTRPLGTVPWLRHHPESETWGSVVFGGPLVTGGGLVFVAATQDDMFRALDVESGEVLWEHQLPAGGQSVPMTYRVGGTQYVVIAAGGRSGIGSPGDWIVAFALPRRYRP